MFPALSAVIGVLMKTVSLKAEGLAAYALVP
jgi:hypothetical protein